MSFVNEFQLPQIPLEDIKTATKNFGADYCIGKGGFGKVYRGELLLSEVRTIVAIKRLDSELGQGATEFWKEIMLLSRYKHKNLVSLLGFCVESGENILVYEYISNKSLDWYITRPDILSWKQRLHICIDAAHGLQYLHDPNQNHERVIHRDIKSANILLDDNWKAKIADFGLSKLGPANLQLTFLFSTAAGTMGYCDPSYYETGCLTKESDIYSFGVVLFEVLCGRFAQQNYDDIRRFLSNLAPKCYEEKKIDTIINSTIKKQISPKCLQVFSNIAYRCLRRQREERPSMAEIVKELGTALRCQEEYEFEKGKDGAQLESYSDEYWESKLPGDLGLIIKTLKIPRSICTVKKELFLYLRKGKQFDGGAKFFWINDDGTKCLLISSKRFLTSKVDKCLAWEFQHDSRFSMVAQFSPWESHDVKFQIQTSMLSLGSMYTASLVFKFHNQNNVDLENLVLTTTKWKTDQLSTSSTHTAQKTTGDWYKIKMWNFINNGMNADFEIVLEELTYTEHPHTSEQVLMIQGIDFEPIEMHEEIERFRSFWISKDDEYLGKKLPTGYQDCIEMADNRLDDTSQRELYTRFCEGFLGNNGRLWFSLCKSTGGLCSMLRAKDILCKDPNYERLETLCLAESRFSEVKKLHDTSSFCFKCRLESPMFSPEYTYACYLVFKLEDNQILHDETRLFKVVCKMDEISQGTLCAHFNLLSMNIPTIEPKSEYGMDDLSNKQRSEGLRMPKYNMEHLVDTKMEERKDGWMEVMLCKPVHRLQDRNSLEVILSKFKGGSFTGIIVQGIEFRPV